MRNTMEDLRNHMFEALENLKDTEVPEMGVEEALAVAKLGSAIIGVAKVELQAVKLARDLGYEIGTGEKLLGVPFKQFKQINGAEGERDA